MKKLDRPPVADRIVFAVDVGNYTVLSNHQHLIASTRPDIAANWSDEEVAWRWRLAWPKMIKL